MNAVRRVRLVLLGGVLVVAAAGVAVAVRRDGVGDVRVVEAGVSAVQPVSGVFGDEPHAGAAEPVASWAAVVENTRTGRTARGIYVRVELVDEAGDVVEAITPRVGGLGPGRQTVVVGATDEGASQIADIRVEVDRIDRWEETRDVPAIEVRDVEVAYGPANQPLVTYTAMSGSGTAVRGRATYVVYRNRDGHILAGSSRPSLPTDPPLEPRERATGAVQAHFAVPDLATVELYVEPTDAPSA